MSNNNAKLMVSWKNCFIWSGIMAALSIVIRALMWYFLFYMGDEDIFSTDFCYVTLPLMLISGLLPLTMYVSLYRKFAKLGAKYPFNRKNVAKGDYGKPIILRTVTLVVLGVLWIAVCLVMVSISCELVLYDKVDQEVCYTFLGIFFAGLLLDVVLLQLGNFYFKPNEIQNA